MRSAVSNPPRHRARNNPGTTKRNEAEAIDVVAPVDPGLTDGLTGLPGLLALRVRLEALVAESPPSGPRPALVLVDLDGFRGVDRYYGREASDRVLAVVGKRLDGLAALGSKAFRTGTDEYAVLFENTTTFEALDEARRALKIVASPIETAVGEVCVTASAAVVMLGNRDRADGLVRDADVTMYRAKVEGGNRVDIYNWELDNWAVARKKDVERLAREVEELRLQNQLLTKTTTIDPETGMPNRVSFDADHLQLHARRSRNAEPYSMLLAVIDHVDEANKCLAGGSRVINAVGQSISETIRLSDRAYRVAENLFAVLLQGTDQRQAIAAGERVRANVDKLALEHPGNPSLKVTLTVGAIEAGFRHSSIEDVLTEASQLVTSKRGSVVNQVVWPH